MRKSTKYAAKRILRDKKKQYIRDNRKSSDNVIFFILLGWLFCKFTSIFTK